MTKLYESSVQDVSIVMAVHNGRKFLSQCIQSIRDQSLQNFEFIIIDDGSTDGSEIDLKMYAKEDSRIRLISHQNHGLTPSLNEGLMLATAPFVARMDADDVATPDRLSKQVNFLKANRDIVCVGAEVELISEDGTKLGRRSHPRDHDAIRSRLLHGDGGAMTHPSIMFRREAALEIGGFDERFVTAQDLDFFLRISEVGKLANMRETLLYWRQHPSSINRTRSETWRTMKTLAIANTINRIGAEAYSTQLFAAERKFTFPSDYLGLARFATQKRRPRAGLKYSLLALRYGPNRLAALNEAMAATFSIAMRSRQN